MEHVYYKLKNGDMIPKHNIEKAFKLIESLLNGFDIVTLNDSEIISYGDKVDAIKLFRDKYDCGLVEAKAVIDFLRQ
jgi:hypothetical protein